MDEKRQNREFKFRAYDTKNKKWLHEYETMGGFSLKGEIVVFHELWNGISLTTLLEYVVIMQYTGLKDKNGMEVFEGDLWKRGDFIGEIVFENSGWQIKPHSSSKNIQYPYFNSNVKTGEVIGNIYQSELSES